MLGKANEIKTKQVFTEYREREQKLPGIDFSSCYETIRLDAVINRTLAELGNSEILQIHYQMGHDEQADSALIIYK